MNKFAFGAALAALSLAVPGSALAQRTPAATIVIVDTSRIYRDCTACRAAQTQLQSMGTALQTRQQQLGQPLQTEATSIEQAAAAARNLTGAARTAAEASLQTRLQALQTRQTSANQELSRQEQTLRSSQAHVLQQINTRLQPIVNAAMTAHGANIALDQGSTLARSQALDITTEVLGTLNQQLPNVSVTPLPQQPGQPAAQQPQGR